MKTTNKLLLLPLAVALAFASVAQAQTYGPTYASAQTAPAFSQQELDSMLAPIALYPDSLLSQILMASTYPREVVEAARWSRANPDLPGEAAVRAVERRDWDPSVKSLVAFPQILSMMGQRIDWTEQLGDAFLAQESQVMDSVQLLRDRAYRAGNLRSNEQISVDARGGIYFVEPAQPQYVYVPYYDPMIVYGTWWWPSRPPVYWAPWPGYHHRPGYAVFSWGSAIAVPVGFFFGDFDWHHRHARVVNVNNYYNRTVVVNNTTVTRVDATPGVWRHDPDHRRGAPYRDAALRERFAGNADGERRGEIRPRDARAAAPAVIQGNRNGSEQASRVEARPAARSAETTRPDTRAAETRSESRTDARHDSRGEDPNWRAKRDAARIEVRPAATAEARGADNSRRQEAREPAPRVDARPEVRAGAGRRDNAGPGGFANMNARAETRTRIEPAPAAQPQAPARTTEARAQAPAVQQNAPAHAAAPAAAREQVAAAPHHSGNNHGDNGKDSGKRD
jgi:hypothetical protein